MSKREQKPILRTVKVSFPLDKAFAAVGFKEKVQNEYLDADSYDDVLHEGYSERDSLKMNDRLPAALADAEKLFPSELAVALERAERDCIAGAIAKNRRQALVDALLKISFTSEYSGVDSDSDPVSVSVGVKIEEANISDDRIEVKIVNPEHLLNGIISGMGRFYPHEIICTEALSAESLRSYFLANIGDFFAVYGESLPSLETRNWDSPKEGDVAELFGDEVCQIGDEVASRIVDAVEAERLDMQAALKVAVAVTEKPLNSIKKIVRDEISHRSKGRQESYDRMLGELGA